MWVNKSQYLEIRDAAIKATASQDALVRHNAALETSIDWFRLRISQLEHERAVMLKKYLDIDVPVQTIERKRDETQLNPYHMTADFNDVGNEMAAKLGISWDAETGAVTYGESRMNNG